MRLTSLFALAAIVGTWTGNAGAEPLASVNNLNPLTSSAKFEARIAPLDASGNPIDALRVQAAWTFQQQSITATIPASSTPYTFTGVEILYSVYAGTGIKPKYSGGFTQAQASRSVPAGIPLLCVYTAPILTDGDLTCTPTPDAVPPSVPGPLLASVAGISTINLIWGVATDNVGVTGYGVERCLGGACTAAFALIGNTAGAAYSDSGLASGQAYTYRVRANDAANNFGPYSNLASATTLVPPPPPPPPPVCVRIPPVSPTAGEVLDFTAKMTDSSGAVWTIAPRVLGSDTAVGQVTLKRNGVTQFGGIEYAYIKGTSPVCVADFKSGPGVSCWNGTGWGFVGGAAGC